MGGRGDRQFQRHVDPANTNIVLVLSYRRAELYTSNKKISKRCRDGSGKQSTHTSMDSSTVHCHT